MGLTQSQANIIRARYGLPPIIAQHVCKPNTMAINRPIIGTSRDGQHIRFSSTHAAGKAGYLEKGIYQSIKKGFRHMGYYWRYA